MDEIYKSQLFFGLKEFLEPELRKLLKLVLANHTIRDIMVKLKISRKNILWELIKLGQYIAVYKLMFVDLSPKDISKEHLAMYNGFIKKLKGAIRHESIKRRNKTKKRKSKRAISKKSNLNRNS